MVTRFTKGKRSLRNKIYGRFEEKRGIAPDNLFTHSFTRLLINFKDTKFKFQLNEAKMRQYAKEVSTADSDSKDEANASTQSSPSKPETNDDNTNNGNNNNNNIMAAMPKVFVYTLTYSFARLLTHY